VASIIFQRLAQGNPCVEKREKFLANECSGKTDDTENRNRKRRATMENSRVRQVTQDDVPDILALQETHYSNLKSRHERLP